MINRDYFYSGKTRFKFLMDETLLEDEEIEYVETAMSEANTTFIYHILDSTIMAEESENKMFATKIRIFAQDEERITNACKKLEKIVGQMLIEE